MTKHSPADSIAERVRALTSPRETWRNMSGGARYIAYARISLQFITAGVLLVLGLPLLSTPMAEELPAWGMVLVGVIALVSLVLTLIVFELHPDLNSQGRRDVVPFFRAGLILNLLAWLLSLVVVLLPAPDGYRVLGALASVWLLFTLALAYFPWLRHHWVGIICLSLLTVVVIHQVVGAGAATFLWGISAVGLLATVLVTVWTIELFREVEAARRTEAALRVTEERLRFAQELHDTLGQHLAVMSLKAELALALARRGDERLEDELQQLQRLAKTSMSEMREVVAGYRSINLATEVAGSKSLLADSGIALHVDGDALDVEKPDRELAAWFVREATTNVLKHSDATAVRLTLNAGRVSMSNDGVHHDIRSLSGLRALRGRAEDVGARLIVEKDGATFTASLILGGDR